MKRTAFALTTMLAVTTLVTTAHAGSKAAPLSPTINAQQRFALGTVSDARNTVDSTSRIECQVGVSSAGFGMACYAMDAKGQFGVCFSSNPSFAQLAAAVQSDTFVEFHWDEAGNCTSLFISQDSMAAPKQP